MTTEDNEEITPEKVRELLGGITPGEWECFGQMEQDGEWGNVYSKIKQSGNILAIEHTSTITADVSFLNAKFIAAAPAIAKAYLKKCEEVDRLNTIIEYKEQDQTEKFNMIMKCGTEVRHLQAIIEKQREVLQFYADNDYHFDPFSREAVELRDDEGEKAREALALTETEEKKAE